MKSGKRGILEFITVGYKHVLKAKLESYIRKWENQ